MKFLTIQLTMTVSKDKEQYCKASILEELAKFFKGRIPKTWFEREARSTSEFPKAVSNTEIQIYI